MPPMSTAPASAHSSRMLLDLLGRVVDARHQRRDQDAARDPGRLSSATASIRLRGCGVCGSLARHAFSSSVGIERLAANRLPWICFISSMSRSSSGDLVSTDAGRARVAHRLPDAGHQPVAALDPLVRVGVGAEGDVLALPATASISSARATSGALTLTTISRSKSRPALKSR